MRIYTFLLLKLSADINFKIAGTVSARLLRIDAS